MITKGCKQMTLFDFTNNHSERKKISADKNYSHDKINLNVETIIKLKKYQLEDYLNDIEKLGLEATWNNICEFIIDYSDEVPSLLEISNFGELYEIGLATQNKLLKKKSGQYYTPDDVALVMSKWLDRCEGDAVCDVACGTGKLILTYLDMIGYEKARRLISSGKLYLYDFDNVALKICWTTIAIKYGIDISNKINDVFCDFLDSEVKLPSDCKVISNPPYAHLDEIQEYWKHTDILMDTKEFYSAFMEKIFCQSKSSVVITPFSFISGTKFYSLRKYMCEIGNGFIVAFDNVPGNIFCGRKHGIFNTNTANSVRAAITVLNAHPTKKGFRIAPLIRFKNEQRKEVLDSDKLENLLADDFQSIDESNPVFKKIDKNLSEIFSDWCSKSNKRICDFIEKKSTRYFIDMPNTCRYFTSASVRKLNRAGAIELNVTQEEAYNLIYCMINSSFTYWWWRVFDGGITYPINLLYNMPIPINLLTEEDKSFFKKMREKLSSEENKYLITKLNAGVLQENIKFPEKYRLKINERLLNILGYSMSGDIFDSIHDNFFK